MHNFRRMTVGPEEAQHRSDQCADHDRQFARTGNMRDAEVSGQDLMSREIRQNRECRSRGDRAAAGQPIESIRQIHSIGTAGHHQNRPQYPERF